MYNTTDLIADTIRPHILQLELDGLYNNWKGQDIPFVEQALSVTTVYNEVSELRDIEQIKSYLISGGYFNRRTVKKYIAQLYMESLNSYN